jgi:hypothetical protein
VQVLDVPCVTVNGEEQRQHLRAISANLPYRAGNEDCRMAHQRVDVRPSDHKVAEPTAFAQKTIAAFRTCQNQHDALIVERLNYAG